jgi:hypothetical protein
MAWNAARGGNETLGNEGMWSIDPPVPVLVQVTIPFTTNRRRDNHNYCGSIGKSVIDGLVIAGVVPDDSTEWLGHREPILYKGDKVIVTLEPL